MSCGRTDGGTRLARPETSIKTQFLIQGLKSSGSGRFGFSLYVHLDLANLRTLQHSTIQLDLTTRLSYLFTWTSDTIADRSDFHIALIEPRSPLVLKCIQLFHEANVIDA